MELPLAGIVPDGVVHPAVQSDTAGTRGSGASLDSGLPERFADSLGELSYVRVHIDDTADRLNRSVSARAFATGTDVYVAKGEYSPGSADGEAVRARARSRRAAARRPLEEPLTVSNPGDALETEADAVADELA